MKIREVKRYARQSLKNRWGFALLLTIVTFGIYGGIQVLVEMLISGGFEAWVDDESTSATMVGYILSVILAPIIMSNYWVFLGIVRKEPVKIGDLFDPFLNFGLYVKAIGLYILVAIYTLLWTLLLIIPGIIKGMAYSQAYFVLKDHPDYSINRAITESRKLMDGYKWSYFLLMLSFIGWGILSILTLGIGFLWLIPYVTASLASFYEQLSNHPKEA
ncbi:DUF975 family protein [Bacillus songklensis]|uniref:DUF975 family protein n=1 Tax=Bacillus songklensis TaxID=1069116 RepID=A0ABV8B4F1_9BACI